MIVRYEQDKNGLAQYDYSRERNLYGNQWKELKEKIKLLKEKGA